MPVVTSGRKRNRPPQQKPILHTGGNHEAVSACVRLVDRSGLEPCGDSRDKLVERRNVVSGERRTELASRGYTFFAYYNTITASNV